MYNVHVSNIYNSLFRSSFSLLDCWPSLLRYDVLYSRAPAHSAPVYSTPATGISNTSLFRTDLHHLAYTYSAPAYLTEKYVSISTSKNSLNNFSAASML